MAMWATKSRTGAKAGWQSRWSGGQGFVEFSLIVVPLLILLCGIIAGCMAVYSYNFVSQAARDAVRYAIVNGATSPTPATADSIKQFVLNEANGINTGALTVSTTWTPDNKPGSVVSVQVTYNFQPLFPVMGATVPLSSAAQMVISR